MWLPLTAPIFLTALGFAAPPDVDRPLASGASAPDDAAVVVGIEDYVFLPDVPHAANDARAVEDYLVTTRGVPPQKVERLTQAGKEQIAAAVARAGEATGTVWIYLAGHGVAAPSTGERLFLGDDARQDPAAFEARGLLLSDLQATAAQGGADVVLLVDACFNGRARDGASMAEGTRFAVPVYATDVADGSLLWAASGPDQLARPLHSAQHGAFTYAMLGALRGWADGVIDGAADGQVTAEEAEVYVQRALPQLGIDDQRPELGGARDRVLARGSLEPAPDLSGVASAPPVPAARVVAVPGFDPDLVAAAAVYDLTLPLEKRPFGWRDATEQRVRQTTLRQLIKSTKKGRAGNRVTAVGLGATVAGFLGGFGFGMAGAVTGTTDYVVPIVASSVVGATGIGLVVGGSSMAMSSLEPDLRGRGASP